MKNEIDRDSNTVAFQRTLASPPDDVFDAWTRPERISQWWDPSGQALTACTIDLRVGGAFRFETAGHAPPFVGTYSVVERPHRLEFEAMGAHGTVSLRAEGAGTRMDVTIASPSREHFETFLKLGVDVGTGKTLDQLVAHVAPRPERGARAAG